MPQGCWLAGAELLLRRRRIMVARQRLADSDVPAVRIAGETGFADQSDLTRRFRASFRDTPVRYRLARAAGQGVEPI